MKKSAGQPRYPGAQPFETGQKLLFFGRDRDVEALTRLILQEQLTVVYSKSGMGKSSLLNAGVIPLMLKEEEYFPVRIRFNAYDQNAPAEGQVMPLVRTVETLRSIRPPTSTFLDRLIESDESLWRELKVQQLLAYASGQTVRVRLLLIFDQFEELFTYPAQAMLSFRRQLAEALYAGLPQRYWDILDLYGLEESPLSNEEQRLLETPLNLKVVAAIRQDRMHLLGNLSDYLPTISKNWFELRNLSRTQAEAAITQPAALEGDYFSAPFSYDKKALEHILQFLTDDGREKIESSQLQIVCHSLELKAAAQGLSLIRPGDIGDLDAVIENYYMEKIATVGDEEQQLAARQLVEEGLILEEEERRLSLYEGYILRTYNVSPEVLRRLVDSHLLRAEPSLQGGYTYELSHDTLVPAVLKARAKRREEERLEAERKAELRKAAELEALRQKAEEERQRAEDERQMREQAEKAKAEAEAQRAQALKNAQQARVRTRLAILFSVLALTLAFFAGWSYREAAQQRKVAEKNQQEAADQRNIAEKALKERIDIEVKKYLDAAERMKEMKDFDIARDILEEARNLVPDNQEVKKMLEELK